MRKISLGTAFVKILEYLGVKFIFGIPGVHTVELYRALSDSKIRHITTRHEQAAGFMADGYARMSGKPGVCLVITGPGMTNILTAMAQARSDSIPMLVISGVNKLITANNTRGRLHELPNQSKLIKQVALASYTILEIEETYSTITKAFLKMSSGRPGPVHIQIPIDVMEQKILEKTKFQLPTKKFLTVEHSEILIASEAINKSKKPCIILGGGARSAKGMIEKFVDTLQAPTISTINARDLLGQNQLHIPASPSLSSVRNLLKEADLILALGTEMGQTDYDMYGDGFFPILKNLIRVDIDKDQLKFSPPGTKNIKADVSKFCTEILKYIQPKKKGINLEIIKSYKSSLRREIPPIYKKCELLLSIIVKSLPDAIIVGDSTQPTYYGNLHSEITTDNRWFNSATGFGTLGYATSASMGAQLACSDKPVICIIGDGGFQFSLAELGTAIDESIPVLFLIWNNSEYKEIRTFMEAQSIPPIGVSPKPPNLELIAKSYSIDFKKIENSSGLSEVLLEFSKNRRPLVIELIENTFKS